MIESIVIIILAYSLDLLLGDPRWLPHPVKGIGYLVRKLDMPLRKAIRNKRVAGSIFAIIIIGMVYLASFAAIRTATYFNRYLGFVLSTLFIYTALAIKDLKVESMRVYRALEKDRIDLARRSLSLIVGRDTERLDDKGIIRATVETVAENIVDGIISPIFYALLGGAPLALAYKAVSTLDSMVGYKNDSYKDFGWFSARIDDWANFIPARITYLLLPLASCFAGYAAKDSFKVALRDGRKNPSPNSGIAEAAMAGALGVRLGGLNHYNSTAVMKPLIGDGKNSLSPVQIKESIRVAYVSALLSVILAVSIIYIFHAIR